MVLQILQILKFTFVENLTGRFQYSVHASEMYMYKMPLTPLSPLSRFDKQSCNIRFKYLKILKATTISLFEKKQTCDFNNLRKL